MVMSMMEDIKRHVRDWADEEEVMAYLAKILNKEAFDNKGLIYGMGHAVYSLSDPREVIFKGFVEKLAAEKGKGKELALYNAVESAAPKLIARERKIYKGVSPNNNALILQGAVPAAILALVLGGLVDALQKRVVPRGLRKGGVGK